MKAEFTIPNEEKQGKAKRAHQHPGTKNPSAIHLLLAGLNRWLVTGKYQSHRLQKTWFTKSNVLWLKIGIAGFAILMVMRHDFQFTINLSGSGEQSIVERSTESATVNQMSIAQPVAMKSKSKTASKKSVKRRAEKSFKAKSVDQYVNHYAEVAQEEMRRFGIPASFKMAQAILASQAGTTAAYNNHFGRHLKGINFKDDRTNWRAHSLYLVENYPELLTAGSDYMDWVNALKKTDYSLDEAYTQRLLSLIKEYKLYQLDY